MVSGKNLKIYGTTKLGERGQVVIPVEIRQKMGLKTGDKLLVFCKEDQVVGLVPADKLDAIMRQMTKQVIKKIENFKKIVKNAQEK